MKINDIGGEFALIEHLARLVPRQGADLIQGIGDDAAVLRTAPEPAPYLLVTTDMLVENEHFRTQWAAPEQIGYKAAECNVSDIAAMGGTPTWMFVALALPRQTELEWVEALYRGLARSCHRHGIALAGGDTTQGPTIGISITLLGSVTPEKLCLRSHAKVGDLLVVTGTLGASAAGLALLDKGREATAYLLEKHRAPSCRMDLSDRIAPLAHAMIDISDGLASEVRHICSRSKVGAELDERQIPLHPDVAAAGRLLGVDPLQWALGGGEDYELLFSIAPEQWPILQATMTDCHVVGRITEPAAGVVLIQSDGTRRNLAGGFTHFA
jgi:thiamine-monophosphate kinase